MGSNINKEYQIKLQNYHKYYIFVIILTFIKILYKIIYTNEKRGEKSGTTRNFSMA